MVSVCMPPLARSFQHNSLSIDFSSYFQSVACLYVPQCVCVPLSTPFLSPVSLSVHLKRASSCPHEPLRLESNATKTPSSCPTALVHTHFFVSALFSLSSLSQKKWTSATRVVVDARSSTHDCMTSARIQYIG